MSLQGLVFVLLKSSLRDGCTGAVYTKTIIQESPSGPSEDTFSGPAVDNETALRDGCTGAVYTKPIQETLFLVFHPRRETKNKA
jgi:hypothetical protein